MRNFHGHLDPENLKESSTEICHQNTIPSSDFGDSSDSGGVPIGSLARGRAAVPEAGAVPVGAAQVLIRGEVRQRAATATGIVEGESFLKRF